MGKMLDPLPRHGWRTVLRRMSAQDLRSFQSYRHDADVGRYQGWLPQPDPEALAFLTAMERAPFLEPGRWVQLGIARREDDLLIGDIGLCVSADGTQAEVGFTLSRGAQGRGLATEAVSAALALVFAFSEVDRVVAITDGRNHPAMRLLERLGMHRVTTQEAVYRGQPCLEHSYALPRPMPGVTLSR